MDLAETPFIKQESSGNIRVSMKAYNIIYIMDFMETFYLTDYIRKEERRNVVG